MAKAPFWLRGGKGKLAGSVLFKGEKGTIVRENVTPRNPRTGGMMRQRVVWATVTQAAKLMLPIIGISFEGIGAEKLNRRRFVQLNASLLSNEAKNIMASGVNSAKLAFSGKGNNQLIPNPYIISRGSLQLPLIEMAPLYDNVDDIFHSSSWDYYMPFGEYTPLQLWKLLFNMEPGSQFTVPYISTRNSLQGYSTLITDDMGENIDGIRHAWFFAPRVVLNTEDAQAIQITGLTTKEQIELALASVVDEDKTDAALLGYMTSNMTVSASDTTLHFQLTIDYNNITGIAGRTCQACGCIYSKQDADGVWHYTNSRLVVALDGSFAEANNKYYGLSIDNAINTYRKSGSTDKNYLQTGGEGGNI